MRFMNTPRLPFDFRFASDARFTLGLGALVLTGPVSFAHAAQLAEIGPAGTPFAHTRFCMRYPEDCNVTNGGDPNKPELMSSERRAELWDVNEQVNRSIIERRQNDGAAFENWLINPMVGDCNDFAVSKRHLLIKKGWPDNTLLLTEVKLHDGEHHLVLIARTSDGDLVLDNRTPALRSVSEANSEYQWVRMESKSNPQFWSLVRTSS